MEALLKWINNSTSGHLLYTAFMSMLPIVELRGGLPFGVALGLDIWPAFLAAVIGNMIPVPFIILFIRHIFQWMRLYLPKLSRLVDKLEEKAHLNGRKVTKYKYLGLFILVAIPLPGTGAWTGSLVASVLDMHLWKSFLTIFLGVLTAGVIVSVLTLGITSIL